MSVGPSDLDPIGAVYAELPPSFEIFDTFTAVQDHFKQNCEVFHAQPTHDTHEQLLVAANLVVQSFNRSVAEISQIEPEVDEQITAITSLILLEDRERVSIMRQLTGSDLFKSHEELAAKDKTKSMFAKVKEVMEESEDWPQAIACLTERFETFLLSDLNIFLNLHPLRAAGETESSSTARVPGQRHELLVALGKHGLDIAKIGAGIAIGNWLVRRQRQN